MWHYGPTSPAQQSRAPGESASHGFEQHQVTPFDAAIGHRVGERKRDRGRRRVAVAIKRHDDFAGGDTELVRSAVDDALVGLMGDKPVDVLGTIAGLLKDALDHVGDRRNRVAEDFASFHPQVADGLRRGWAAIDIKLVLVASIRAQARGKDAAILARSLLDL